jgi:hypothetical protein
MQMDAAVDITTDVIFRTEVDCLTAIMTQSYNLSNEFNDNLDYTTKWPSNTVPWSAVTTPSTTSYVLAPTLATPVNVTAPIFFNITAVFYATRTFATPTSCQTVVFDIVTTGDALVWLNDVLVFCAASATACTRPTVRTAAQATFIRARVPVSR